MSCPARGTGRGRDDYPRHMRATRASSEEMKSTCPPKLSELFIYIGADSTKKVRRQGKQPVTTVFDSGFPGVRRRFFASKALDDRAGCEVLLELMKSDLEYDTYFAFHTLEEEGLRGAYGTGFAISPTSPSSWKAPLQPTFRRLARKAGGARLGEARCFLSRRATLRRELYERAARLADEDGIPWQPRPGRRRNDGGRAADGGRGVRVLAVSMPCRYCTPPPA